MGKLMHLVALAMPAASGVIQRQTQPNPSLAVPAAVPSDASPNIDLSFPGFAFELASVVEYAQDANGNPNTFSQNLINAINSKTGGKPIVRFGGTSADFARLIPTQTEAALPVAAENNYQDVGNTTIGPSFWPLLLNFPSAQYVFQIPLGIDSLDNAVGWATAGVQALGFDRIDALEIGNEPDLYPNQNEVGEQLLPPQYQGELSDSDYVFKFGAFSSAVAQALGIDVKTPIFQALDTAVHFDASEATVQAVPNVFGAGLNANNSIKAVSHHYYQTNGDAAFGAGLLNHTAISTHLDYFRPFISYLQSSTNLNGAPIPFVLGEVGNSLNMKNDYSYQASLAAALWTVDFSLYSMSIGVSRIYWQQIMHSGFDLWLPVDSAGVPAQTFSTFYGVLFSAEFIGTNGGTRVSQLPLANTDSNVVAYGAYDGGNVARVAIVNLDEYEGSNNAGRGAKNVQITGLGGAKSVTVKTLSSPNGAGAEADSITFGGSQWTYASGGQEVTGVDPSGAATLPVNGGAVTVSVPDSSAVLLFVES